MNREQQLQTMIKLAKRLDKDAGKYRQELAGLKAAAKPLVLAALLALGGCVDGERITAPAARGELYPCSTVMRVKVVAEPTPHAIVETVWLCPGGSHDLGRSYVTR